jgi:hypothetical protein
MGIRWKDVKKSFLVQQKRGDRTGSQESSFHEFEVGVFAARSLVGKGERLCTMFQLFIIFL